MGSGLVRRCLSTALLGAFFLPEHFEYSAVEEGRAFGALEVFIIGIATLKVSIFYGWCHC